MLEISFLLITICSLTNGVVIKLDQQKGFREGDIKEIRQSRAFGFVNNHRDKWPNGVVPYEIHSDFSATERAKIIEGMELLTANTNKCIRFVPKTSAHDNYLSIISEKGCWSFAGMIQGKQELSLEKDGCVILGTVVHELMHAIGFFHEQNRPDRDNAITVNLNNVDPNFRNQFEKYTGKERQTFSTPYDLKSVMHYSEYAFSFNGFKTIIPKNGEKIVALEDRAKNVLMSENDVKSVKTLYQCESTSTVTEYSFTIINDRNFDVELRWVDDSKMIKFLILKPSVTVTRTTRYGFWFKSSNGKKHFYKATKQSQTVRVSSRI